MREFGPWLIFASCLALAGKATAALINVPGDYPTIQSAITASVNGDEIVLADQTFSGDGNRNLIIHGKAITIRSAGGDPTSCVIDLQGSSENAARAFVFTFDETPATVIRGIGMINGYHGTSALSDGQGGAIFASHASPRFENCRIRDCWAIGVWSAEGFGGAAYLVDSQAEFVDCEFVLNDGDNMGGAVAVYGGAPSFTRCRFAENTSTFGAAVLCRGGVSSFIDCVFEGHETVGQGGAIFAEAEATLICEGTRFENNGTWVPSGASAGAIWGDYSVTGSFRHCDFLNNHASYAAGAVEIGNSVFEDCVFAGNTALPNPGDYGGYGGALACFYETTLTRCTFSGNAANFGSAIYWGESGPLTIAASILCDGEGDGVIFCPNASGLTVSCTNVHGNSGGDWTGCLEGLGGSDGNMSVPPAFCGIPGSFNFKLQEDSPCAPANNDCQVQIGARPVGCGITGVLLAGLRLRGEPGRVTATWETSEALEPRAFALGASRGGESWSVPVAAVSPGVYAAVDEAPQLASGGEVAYELELVDNDGARTQLTREVIRLTSSRYGVALERAAPNPFNPNLTIVFTVDRPQRLRVTVFDAAGRRVAQLADGPYEAGRHELSWDGRNEHGSRVASGSYLVRVTGERGNDARRITLLK